MDFGLSGKLTHSLGKSPTIFLHLSSPTILTVFDTTRSKERMQTTTTSLPAWSWLPQIYLIRSDQPAPSYYQRTIPDKAFATRPKTGRGQKRLQSLCTQSFSPRYIFFHQGIFLVKVRQNDNLDTPTQGDLEKAMGNKPVESMDRERACIPSLQVNPGQDPRPTSCQSGNQTR